MVNGLPSGRCVLDDDGISMSAGIARFPTPHVKRAPDHLAFKCALEIQRTAAGAVAAPLLGVLTGLQMAAKKSEHVSP